MTREIDRLMRRTHHYFYEDGLVETGVGLIFLVSGAVIYSWVLVRGHHGWQIATALGMPLLILAGTFLVRVMISQLKERLVYPRTGFVSYRQEKKGFGRWVGVIGALLVALFILLAPPSWPQMPAVEGLLLALILGYLGYRGNVVRFYFLALAVVVVGVLTSALASDDLIGSALTFGGLGVLMMGSGIIRFLAYLQANPQTGEVDG